MSSKTVKFEISLEKLTVKFEGDIQIAERVQGEITSAIHSLASAQGRMLAAPKVTPPATADVGAGRRRSRRRRRAGGDGIDPAVIDGVVEPNGNGDADSADLADTRRQRRTGGGPSALLSALKNEGFFATKQTNAAVRDALAKKGHSFKSNEINPPLVAMTKQGHLQREKNQEDQWIYWDK